MRRPIAILAGGLGTRLYPLTERIPKPLVEVAGKPFIVHQIELLRRNDLDRIVLCVGHLGDRIQEILGDGQAFGVHIHYVFDGPVLLGTGGALKKALPYLGDSFFVIYGDSYLDIDYRAVGRVFDRSRKRGLMTVYKNANRWDRSNVLFSGRRIVRYDKKDPSGEMEHIDYGLGLLHREALESVPEKEKYDLADVYQTLIGQDQLAGYEVTRRFYEIGSRQGLEETRLYLSTQ